MSTTPLPLTAFELHTTVTALILASARGDTTGMAHLLLDRSNDELLALLAYNARFTAQLATMTYEQPGTDPIRLLEEFALVLAAEPATT